MVIDDVQFEEDLARGDSLYGSLQWAMFSCIWPYDIYNLELQKLYFPTEMVKTFFYGS